MKSGLEGRNNGAASTTLCWLRSVSMKSGLEDRNNRLQSLQQHTVLVVSMKSGLEDRNNLHPFEKRFDVKPMSQ